jgi:hypothetical protein
MSRCVCVWSTWHVWDVAWRLCKVQMAPVWDVTWHLCKVHMALVWCATWSWRWSNLHGTCVGYHVDTVGGSTRHLFDVLLGVEWDATRRLHEAPCCAWARCQVGAYMRCGGSLKIEDTQKGMLKSCLMSAGLSTMPQGSARMALFRRSGCLRA